MASIASLTGFKGSYPIKLSEELKFVNPETNKFKIEMALKKAPEARRANSEE
jgi:hypothetical protein